MTTRITPIGVIKVTNIVHCKICGCRYKRRLKSDVYENTKEEIEKIKRDLLRMVSVKYICNFCKLILKQSGRE